MFKVTNKLIHDHRPEDVEAVHELFKLALRTKIGLDAVRPFMTTTLREMWTNQGFGKMCESHEQDSWRSCKGCVSLSRKLGFLAMNEFLQLGLNPRNPRVLVLRKPRGRLCQMSLKFGRQCPKFDKIAIFT